MSDLPEKVYKEGALTMLSRLYTLLCNCRVTELLNPVKHTVECEYRKKVEPIGLKFEEENGKSN